MLPAEREEAALLPSISPGELSLGLSCNRCSSINQLSSWASPTSSFQFQVCEHCSYRNAKEYQWQNKTIILAADYASNGIYNFIIPLRAHFRSKTSLNPIILLLERRPDVAFLDAISYFPLVRVIKGLVLDTHTHGFSSTDSMWRRRRRTKNRMERNSIVHSSLRLQVYWMLGSIDCLDDLLRAGINLAENVVVVNKELSNSAEEDSLADCNTIVAVQNMFK